VSRTFPVACVRTQQIAVLWIRAPGNMKRGFMCTLLPVSPTVAPQPKTPAVLLLSLLGRRMAPSPALTGISRVTLGHREELAIQRMSDTARLRRHAHAEQDSLEQSAA
jgi:hypothetical protein